MTGFTVGLFAGAVGYFLFATEDGKKIKHKLAKEWQAAQASLVSTGLETVAKTSIRETIAGLLRKYLQIDLHTSTASQTKTASASKSKKTRPSTSGPAKSSAEKFKGV